LTDILCTLLLERTYYFIVNLGEAERREKEILFDFVVVRHADSYFEHFEQKKIEVCLHCCWVRLNEYSFELLVECLTVAQGW
jgi:hypothetical protein